MTDGFIKVAAATPDVTVADPEKNTDELIRIIKEAGSEGASIIVTPELSVTGYTCGDLFMQEKLLNSAKTALKRLAEETKELSALIVTGLPMEFRGRLYNVAALISGGAVLGFVPKTHIPNYGEFYEARNFVPAPEQNQRICFFDREIPFGTKLLFACREIPELLVGAEICEDLFAPDPPSTNLALAGATVIVNLSASDELTGKDTYRRELVKNQSARLIAGYIYACAGEGESTGDLVFPGHNLIAENGRILKESKRFRNGIILSEIDVARLISERRRETCFSYAIPGGYEVVDFHFSMQQTKLTREVERAPFVPADEKERHKRCEEIFMIQAMGLKKRLSHTHSKNAVIGISGGLDSTLALLVTAKAFDLLSIPRSGIIAVTMPGFGTTDRTYENAVSLIRSIGATFREVPIREACLLHFKDIGQDPENKDVTYENAQARERTQILMDIANQENALVVGTGDLSELALGWATYNGDHMSMYGVNGSVPKTLVRYLVRYYADTCGENGLKKVLLDVLDTPVSPELLPAKDGVISQKTEDIVGPYELHDFFLYYFLRYGFSPKKIYRIAAYAFSGEYEAGEIRKWLTVFVRRFFSQQFKRSCLPDGPKVGSVAVSPRGDLRMPSDASAELWLKEIEEL